MENSGIDRLSNLPEHLLLHILSFLPTETVVSTTVLSKRWQFLWTLVPNLDFDESRSHPTSVDTNDNGRAFAKFVTKFMLRRRERFIRRFRLKCISSHDHSDDLDSWVAFALAQNVQELDLDLNLPYCYGGSPRRFSFHCTQQSCKTLVVLKLRSILISGRLDKVSFPVLKIFHLQLPNVEMSSECLPEIKFLPSGFPVLEELLVVRKSAFGIFYVEIYLPKLRCLAINCRNGFVRIDCPALTHLAVSDGNSRECHLENLFSLVEAKIDLGRQVRKIVGENCGRSVLNVVKAISNVRHLKISPLTMKEIYIASSHSSFRGDDISVFHNLVQVELPFVGCAWEIMILMLEKLENLKCLTLCYKGVSYDELVGRGVDTKELIQQTVVPNCLTSHLTTFCFREFQGSDDEINVTRYILENSLVLKKVIIVFSLLIWSEDERDIHRKLLRKFPSASEGCQLEFRPAK